MFIFLPRTHLKATRFSGIAVLLVLSGGCLGGRPSGALAPGADRPVDAALALQTFDSAWSRIAHTHYDTLYNGVDWEAVRAELRPRAERAGSLAALRGVLTEMLARLGESHFAILPGELTDALGNGPARGGVSGDAGLAVRLVGDELVVSQVELSGAAADAGIRSGWTLLAIDGRPLAPRLDLLRRLPATEQRRARTRLLFQVNAELAGDIGQQLTLQLRDGAGNAVEHRVVLREARGEVVRHGNLPPALARLDHELLPLGADCVGVIRLNVWFGPLLAPFDRAVDAMRHCAGVVIDLRGNPGGVAGMVMGTAGHFLDDTLTLGVMRMRQAELRFKANPRVARADGERVRPFAGPLAILTDEMSASTSEFFAAALQAVGRARVFGTPTAGQALPAMIIRLPTGDVLMHVVADFTGPGGVRIEGQGVLPDTPVETTRLDLLEERDAPLRAALDWIVGAASAGSTHHGGRQQ